MTDTRRTSLTGTSAPIRVSPGPVAVLALSAPTTATAGVGFALKVSAKDLYANLVVSYRGTVSITTTDALARALPATRTFTSTDQGPARSPAWLS